MCARGGHIVRQSLRFRPAVLSVVLVTLLHPGRPASKRLILLAIPVLLLHGSL